MDGLDIGVVVPTLSEEIQTLSSVPDEIPVRIEREGSLNQARNRGVENLDSEIIAILDDDIKFPEYTFWTLAEVANTGALAGMMDWDFGLVAGRFLFFPRKLWVDVGGFDERLRSHMGDTDFAIRADRKDWPVYPFPQEIVEHKGPPGAIERINSWQRAWRSGYLCFKYPTEAYRIIKGVI